MAAIGGPIDSISIDGRTFVVAGDADTQRKLGGYENEVSPNGDNATARIIKTAVAWGITGLNISVDDDEKDHEFLQERADSNEFSDFVVTYASGIPWQGSGKITGELQYSSTNAVASVNIQGQGQLTQQ